MGIDIQQEYNRVHNNKDNNNNLPKTNLTSRGKKPKKIIRKSTKKSEEKNEPINLNITMSDEDRYRALNRKETIEQGLKKRETENYENRKMQDEEEEEEGEEEYEQEEEEEEQEEEHY